MTSEVTATRLKRLQYRASHRGTKEMDWLLGRFAEARLDGMGASEIDLFEALVALPDPDVQAWILSPSLPVDPAYAAIIAELRRFHGLSSDR
ncbi:MAG: succinate dehydrogenase assembly factor 2 [Hyphomicrobiaceae bacterium]